MDLLTLLAAHAGDVVSKYELLDQVWHGRFVGESSLSKAVAELRVSLGDVDRPARFIETVSKRGYRLVAPVWPCPSSSHPRVAVLPFDTLSRDAADDEFAEGLLDTIITELSRVPGLRVISRQSVRHLKGSSRSLLDIGAELHVGAVVAGTVLRDGERIKVTAGLIELDPDERQVWGEVYEDAAKPLSRAHRHIAASVADAVRAALQPGAPPPSAHVDLVDPVAHLALVKARRVMNTATRDTLQAGIRHLQQAIEADPSYAPAHESMATCLAALGFWGHAPGSEVFPRAREAATIALSLDRSLSHGHVALAFARWLHEWEFDGAEEEFLHAIHLNPSSELARTSYGLFLLTVRADRVSALQHAEAACAVDPLSEMTLSTTGWLYLLAGERLRAEQQAEATLQRHPNSVLARYVRGWLLGADERWGDAVDVFAEARGLAADAVSIGFLAHALGRAGRVEPATTALTELAARREREHVPACALALVEAGLGHVDRAFQWLDLSCEARESRLFWFGLLPAADPLRDDPRFAALAARLGIPLPAHLPWVGNLGASGGTRA